LIRNFMIFIGPISSIYDFLTFYVLLRVFHATESLFHTGWFVESLATQTLALFVIRTAGNPLRSRPLADNDNDLHRARGDPASFHALGCRARLHGFATAVFSIPWSFHVHLLGVGRGCKTPVLREGEAGAAAGF